MKYKLDEMVAIMQFFLSIFYFFLIFTAEICPFAEKNICSRKQCKR